MRTGVEKSAAALDNLSKFHYNTLAIGVWRSLVSRLVRVQEASGSNPDTPTKNKRAAFAALLFLIYVGIRKDGTSAHTGAKIESWRAIFSPWESPWITERNPQDCEP